MPRVSDHDVVEAPLAAGRDRARPVVLGTLSVRVDPSAERMALESALEADVPLYVANMLPLPFFPTTLVLVGPSGVTLPHEEDLEALRATANRAAALGIETQLLRVSSRRPVKALLELVSQVEAGLLVFGPDLQLTRPRTFSRAARRVREQAPCLVWIAPDG